VDRDHDDIGWKWKPLKVERGTGAGGGRRILRSGVSLLKAVVANATAPVRLQEMEPEESVPALRRGEVDIAIGHAYDLVPRDLPVGCERHDLLADPVAAVLPLTDPLHDPQQLSGVVELAQLGDRPWVLPLPGTACYELIQRACGAAGFVPRAVAHCSDFAAMLALVGAGAGVSSSLAWRPDRALRMLPCTPWCVL
jgi:DNA-binding transcriptional LysR family regulator